MKTIKNKNEKLLDSLFLKSKILTIIIGIIVIFLITSILLTNNSKGGEGDEIWSNTFGGGDEEWGRMVLETPDGGFIVVGDTGTKSDSDRDILLTKFDKNGAYIWDKTFHKNQDNIGYSVDITSDNGFIITGYTGLNNNRDSRDLWLIKTNEKGEKEWDKTYGGGKHDEGRSIIETSDNGFLIVGDTNSFGAGNYDLWIVKTDENGTKLWDKTAGGSKRDEGRSVEKTSDGGYIISGRTTPESKNNMDIWLVKTNESGNIEWDESWGLSKMDEGWSATESLDGGFIIAGRTYSTPSGKPDAWVTKTDVNGNEVWTKTYGGNEADMARYITKTDDGGYIIAGRTRTNSAGDFDGWVLRLDKNGSELINLKFGGTQWDEARCIQKTTDHNYIITGRTASSGGGKDDVWLIKLEGIEPVEEIYDIEDDVWDIKNETYTKTYPEIDLISVISRINGTNIDVVMTYGGNVSLTGKYPYFTNFTDGEDDGQHYAELVYLPVYGVNKISYKNGEDEEEIDGELIIDENKIMTTINLSKCGIPVDSFQHLFSFAWLFESDDPGENITFVDDLPDGISPWVPDGDIKITGYVTDKDKKPLENVSLMLAIAEKSEPIDYAYTNESGYYKLMAKTGDYYLLTNIEDENETLDNYDLIIEYISINTDIEHNITLTNRPIDVNEYSHTFSDWNNLSINFTVKNLKNNLTRYYIDAYYGNADFNLEEHELQAFIDDRIDEIDETTTRDLTVDDIFYVYENEDLIAFNATGNLTEYQGILIFEMNMDLVSNEKISESDNHTVLKYFEIEEDEPEIGLYKFNLPSNFNLTEHDAPMEFDVVQSYQVFDILPPFDFENLTINFTVIRDIYPPLISHDQIDSVYEGEYILIETDVTDNNDIEYVKLFYRTNGTSTWNEIEMVTGSSYNGTIPEEDVTINGIDYYLEAKDVFDNIIKSPLNDFYYIEVLKKLPDLKINEITFSDSNPKEGDDIQINATFENNGNFEAVDINIDFYLDDLLIDTIYIDTLNIDEIVERGIIWTAVEGINIIWIKIDVDNDIEELNETNNDLSKNIDVEKAPEIKLPDLIIKNINFSISNPIEGDEVKINATVENIGNLTAEAFIVNFYLNDILIGSWIFELLSEDNSVFIEVIWEAKEGKREIIIIVDIHNKIEEWNETNNEIIKNINVGKAPSPKLPDLFIKSIKFSKSKPIVGDDIEIIASVRNIGDVNVYNFNLSFYIGTTLLHIKEIDELEIGNEINVKINWIAVEGEYIIRVNVDEKNLITEKNETNNNLSKQIIVNPIKYLPDLAVKSIEFSESYPKEGDEIEIAVTIENFGIVSVEKIVISFFMDNELLNNTLMTDKIDPTRTGIVTIVWKATEGPHNLVVKIDANNDIEELNEGNNEFSVDINVGESKVEDDEENWIYFVPILIIILSIIFLIFIIKRGKN